MLDLDHAAGALIEISLLDAVADLAIVPRPLHRAIAAGDPEKCRGAG